ncbi:MAG TPA: pyridoxamine 5'-phosphate oxidase family protein [Pilimelia sp.]|nr:pyridoxamine 5'-phosphate oxidase family protein [Pilimelia sp.]
MASWSTFAAAAPALAAAIRSLLHQYGPGLGYLATVRADGGPRVHPVSPVVTDDGLYCFVIGSPKRRDLERDGRYALHSFPPEDSDDEAYLSGRARPVADRARVARLATHLRAASGVDWRLFEFDIEVAMLARHGQTGAIPLAPGRPEPAVQIWHDPAGPRASRRGGHSPRVARRRAPVEFAPAVDLAPVGLPVEVCLGQERAS